MGKKVIEIPDGDPLVCYNCGSHNVQIKAWVDANTLKFKDLCNNLCLS